MDRYSVSNLQAVRSPEKLDSALDDEANGSCKEELLLGFSKGLPNISAATYSGIRRLDGRSLKLSKRPIEPTAYSILASTPIHLRSRLSATDPVVFEPANGSNTRSPCSVRN